MPFNRQQQRSSNTSGKTDKQRDRQQSSNRERGDSQRGDPARRGSVRLSSVLREMQELVQRLGQSNETTDRERILQDDNFRLRRRNARLLDEAENGTQPEGTVNITDDEFKELEDLRKILADAKIEKPEDLKKKIDEHATLSSKQAERDAVEVYEDAVDALEIPNAKAAVRALTKEGLHIEFKDERVRGDDGQRRTVRVPFCRPKADEKAALVPLVDYIEDELSEFVEVFMTEPADEGHSESDDNDDAGAAGPARKLGQSRERTSAASTGDSNSSNATSTRRLQMQRTGGGGKTSSNNGGVPFAATRGERQQSRNGAKAPSDDDVVKSKRATGGYSL